MRVVALSLLVVASPFAASIAVAAPAATQSPVYADGTYTGPSVDAYYGNVQMQVTITAGHISGFKVLDVPRHTGTSVAINRQAIPMLAREVVAAQSAHVDIITGATYTSEAFIRSLGQAFQQASQAATPSVPAQ